MQKRGYCKQSPLTNSAALPGTNSPRSLHGSRLRAWCITQGLIRLIKSKLGLVCFPNKPCLLGLLLLSHLLTTCYAHGLLACHPTIPSNNQLKAKLSSIKSTIIVLSKAVANLAPKVKKVQASSFQTLQTPLYKGKPSAQSKRHLLTNSLSFASKAISEARPSLVLDLKASNSI